MKFSNKFVLIIIITFNCLFSAQQKINLKDDQALLLAAREGNTKQIEALLKKGVNPNTKDQNKYIPLINALYYTKAKKRDIELLLKYGADINAKTSSGKTALMIAVDNQNLPLAKLLIANNANVNANTEIGRTALYYAIFSEITEHSKSLIKLLLLNGADYQDQKILTKLNGNDFQENKKIFDEAKNEIIQEYREKINKIILPQLQSTYTEQIMPKELLPIIADYSKYSDEEILNNIIEIRTLLGELPAQQAYQPAQHQQELSAEQRAAAAGN